VDPEQVGAHEKTCFKCMHVLLVIIIQLAIKKDYDVLGSSIGWHSWNNDWPVNTFLWPQALFALRLHAIVGIRTVKHSARLEQSQNQVAEKNRQARWDSQWVVRLPRA